MTTANVTTTRYLLLKRANTSVSSTYTGLIGEITVDTDLTTVRVHDGVTAGGHVLANTAQITASVDTIPINANVSAANVEIDLLRANVTAANVEIALLAANAASQQAQIESFVANTGFVTLDQLTANLDIINANLGAYQIFANANALTQTQLISAIGANIGAYQTYANSAIVATSAYQTYANAEIASIDANIGAYQTYANSAIGSVTITIDNLFSNAALQADLIGTVNANLLATNIIIGSLQSTVSFHQALLDNGAANLTAANAAIASLQSNAAVQQNLIDFLTGNASTQTLELNSLTSNAAIQADNLTQLLANAVAQESSLTVLVSNAAAQSTAISGINANIGAYQLYANANIATQASLVSTLLANAIVQAQNLDELQSNSASQGAAIDTIESNLAAKTISISNLSANAALQSVSITNLESNIGSYQTYANANAAAQATLLNTLVSNSSVQALEINNLLSNAASQASSITIIDANLGAATTNILTLQANAATQSISIVAIDANVGSYQLYANSALGTVNATIDSINANIGNRVLEIASLFNNAAVQHNQILAANAAIITANLGMQSYVDDQIFTISNIGNVRFTDTTITTTLGAGQGIILNSAGAGEIAMLDYVGINNTNPGYWLHIGDGTISADNNTGNISIDYSNGLGTSRNATILGYAWWDAGGNGNDNRGIGAHSQFGIYKNDDTFDTKYIEFDLASGNANLTNISVTRVTTVDGLFWSNGVAFVSSNNFGNTEVLAFLVEQNITSANIGSYQAYANLQLTNINSGIDFLDANLGAIVSVTLPALDANIGTLRTDVDTLDANIGAFQTYANTTFITTSYSNTEVKSYLTAFDGNILPAANVTYSLGNEQFQWKDLWVSNNTVYIGNTPVSVENGRLLLNNVPVTADSSNGDLSITGNITQQSAYYETFSNVSNVDGNLICNVIDGATFYVTLSANVTANFVNVNAISGTAVGVTVIVDQDVTPYQISNIQINGGNVQPIRWAGGTENVGTASNTDIMSFSLISLGNDAWRILGQISNYG